MDPIEFNKEQLRNLDFALKQEYLETNNIGCYSSSTVPNCHTRRYHGLLVVPQSNLGEDKYVFLSNVQEKLVGQNEQWELGNQFYPGAMQPKGHIFIESFQLDDVPTWVYSCGPYRIKKELLLVGDKAQLLVKYSLLEGEKVQLNLEMFGAFRRVHDLQKKEVKIQESPVRNGVKIQCEEFSSMLMQLNRACNFELKNHVFYNCSYPLELDRGYGHTEHQLLMGTLSSELTKEQPIVLSVSIDDMPQEGLAALFDIEKANKGTRKTWEESMNRAADQFLSKTERGHELCAGFHWFGRWGRDTFIALPGLCIARGLFDQCESVIDSMVEDMKDGLFTNIGVGKVKEYNSIDASLWFFWTIIELAKAKSDFEGVWKKYRKVMESIFDAYKGGTHFDIKTREDGLIGGGVQGVALTWMDAKVNGEAVTPRRGYPVEINALWYNAHKFFGQGAKAAGKKTLAKEYKTEAKRIKKSFEEAFWVEEEQYLADVITDEGRDIQLRPNQLLALSLPYPLIKGKKAKLAFEAVKEHLFMGNGVRTLAPFEERYVGRYAGGQEQRDRSYHQGVAWPWLLGPYVSAGLNLYGKGFAGEWEYIKELSELALHEGGLGSISELYHGDMPYEGVGTIAQAWSVSELIRVNEEFKKVKNNIKNG